MPETKLIPTGKAALPASYSPRELAGVAWTAVREIFPSTLAESDEALNLRLDLLAEIAVECAPGQFMQAVRKAISLSRSRFDVSVAKVRQCAGLPADLPQSPATRAWLFVVEVLDRHVRLAPEGGWQLEPFCRNIDGKYEMVPVPAIPGAILKAVRALGGWGALKETEPQYFGQRMRDFEGLYREEETSSALVKE